MIKKLLRSVKNYKKQSILTPLFVALEVACECLVVYIMSLLIDSIYTGDMKVVSMYGGILVVLALLSLFFGIIAGKYAAEASCGFAKNLRQDVFYKIQKFSFNNIDKFSTSSLVTRLTTDINNVQNAYMMIIRTAVRAPLMIIVSVSIALSINWKLTMIIFGAIPIIVIGVVLLVKCCMPVLNRLFTRYDNLNGTIRENIKAIRVVKSYVRADFEQEKFEEKNEAVRYDFTIIEKITALSQPIMQLIIYACITLIAIFGAIIIINTSTALPNGEIIFGEFSTGQLSSMINYNMQIMMSLIMLTMVFVMIIMAIPSTKRIVEVLDEDIDIKNDNEVISEVSDGEIVFDNVSFKYSEKAERYALKDINLKINSGETIGIIGGTGSSKSTLVQLIPRLYDATIGEVYVGGENVKKYDITSLRDAVAVVLQKNILFSGTIKENLRWGNENATDEDIIKACKLAHADEFVTKFKDGYDTYIEQGGTNVSGGQKQRLCIARALLKSPKVLILDDSTSAVDTKTDAEIRRAFMEEIPNTTKLIISQRIVSVQDADRIIVMDGGMVNGIGTHQELLETNDIYKEIYEIQTKLNKGEDIDENDTCDNGESVDNTKSAIENNDENIDNTKSAVENNDENIDNAKSVVENNDEKIDIAKSAVENNDEMVGNAKSVAYNEDKINDGEDNINE